MDYPQNGEENGDNSLALSFIGTEKTVGGANLGRGWQLEGLFET